MTPETAIVARLKSDPMVAALVSTRVYRLKLPQQPTLPAVRVQRISQVEHPYHLRGRAKRFRSRIQIDACANEYDSLNPDALGTEETLMLAIDEALAGKAFDAVGSPASIRIYLIEQANAGEEYDGEEIRQVKGTHDYIVIWSPL